MLLTEIWETCNTEKGMRLASTEAYTCWGEHDLCGWNGRLAKPQRSETNIPFSTL